MKKIYILTFVLIAYIAECYAQERSSYIMQRLKHVYGRVDKISDFSGYYVKVGDKAGVCDVDGKEIIAPDKYTYVFYCYRQEGGGYFEVKIGDKAGVCDVDGKEIIAPDKYTYVFYCYRQEGGSYFKVKIGDKAGVCDVDGKEIIAPDKYTDVSYYYRQERGGYFEVKIGDKVGACDVNGKEIIVPKYEYESVVLYKVDVFYVSLKSGENAWFVPGGVLVKINPHQPYFTAPSEKLLAFCDNGLWGYLDMMTGKAIILPQYSSAGDFKNGVAKVSKGNTSFLISNPLKDSVREIAQVSITDGVRSDVDINIVETNKNAESTFAVIIANQSYSDFEVPYAINDGSVFKEYCLKTLGIPSTNIFYFENATLNNMYSAVSRMQDIAEVYDGEAKLIFYYSGQGITDDVDKTAYLLPTDGCLATIKASGYSLEKLYAEIGDLNVRMSILLLDTGYNGVSRENKILQSSRGVALKSRSSRPKGNIVSLSATSSGETALAYEDKSHGLFTYFLLKKLQESKGESSFFELSKYVTDQVKKHSFATYGQLQTPHVICSEMINVSQIGF